MAGFDTVEGQKDLSDHGSDILHSIPHCEYHNCHTDGTNVLLECETSVSRDERLKARFTCCAKKDAVSESKPPLLMYRRYLVIGQFLGKMPG